jgi:hypothetical protein
MEEANNIPKYTKGLKTIVKEFIANANWGQCYKT